MCHSTRSWRKCWTLVLAHLQVLALKGLPSEEILLNQGKTCPTQGVFTWMPIIYNTNRRIHILHLKVGSVPEICSFYSTILTVWDSNLTFTSPLITGQSSKPITAKSFSASKNNWRKTRTVWSNSFQTENKTHTNLAVPINSVPLLSYSGSYDNTKLLMVKGSTVKIRKMIDCCPPVAKELSFTNWSNHPISFLGNPRSFCPVKNLWAPSHTKMCRK